MIEPRRESIAIEQWQWTATPKIVGSKFIALRSWQKDDLSYDYHQRIPLIIDPGMGLSFHHAIVQASVTLLEKYAQGGCILDAGTDSGILAIAAARLYPQAVIDAFDIDPDVLEHAATSLALNNLTSHINLQPANFKTYKKAYDLVMVNLPAIGIAETLSHLRYCLADNGIAILYGIPIYSHTNLMVWHGWQHLDVSHLATTPVTIASHGFKLLDSEVIEEWKAIAITYQ